MSSASEATQRCCLIAQKAVVPDLGGGGYSATVKEVRASDLRGIDRYLDLTSETEVD